MTSQPYSALTSLDPGVVYVGQEYEPEEGASLQIAPFSTSDTNLLDPDERHNRPTNRLCYWYACFLTKVPYVVILLVLALIIPLAVVSWKKYPLPDYAHEDLTKGFETRGTALRKAASTSSAVLDQVRNGNNLSFFPNPRTTLQNLGFDEKAIVAFLMESDSNEEDEDPQPKRRRRDANPCPSQHTVQRLRRSKTSAAGGHFFDDGSHWMDHCINVTFSDVQNNVKFVFESSSGADLFTARSLLGICRAEKQFLGRNVSSCPLLSVSTYVTLLSNKDNCLDLTEEDVTKVRELLDQCAGFYRNGTLTTGTTFAKSGIPVECVQDGYVARMLYHFTDMNFYDKDIADSPQRLRYALAYMVPDSLLEDGRSLQDFYMGRLNEKDLDNGVVRITAVELGNSDDQSTTKFYLFGEYLILDLKYFVLAAFVILVLMIVYLRSVSLLLATLTNVAFSFIFAYFVYSAVFQFKFFPFINILALLILIAVGADDVFVFYDSWQQAKVSEDGLSLERITSKTFSHAALSIFVTSLTTAAAFFTNYVSHITAVCCFGVFAGIAILSNFLFMVTWTPAVIILTDRIWTWLYRVLFSRCETRCFNSSKAFLDALFSKVHAVLFGTIFPFLIGKLWMVWILLLLGVGVGGCVVVFVTPRLRLPVTKDIQLFPSSNLLENWDLNMQDVFQAVKDQVREEAESLPAVFIWGFQARDDGSKMDPDDDASHVVTDNSFNFYDRRSQTWMFHFCRDLQNQTWVAEGYRRNLRCALDAYMEVFNRTCSMDLTFLDPYKDTCCQTRGVPMKEDDFRLCAPAAALILRYVNNPSSFLYSRAELQPLKRITSLGYPFFDTNNNNSIVGYGMRVVSTFKSSFSFEIMDEQYHTMIDFFNKHLQSAPPGVKGGFFSDQWSLSFYDLQNAIARGTYYSIILSLGVALLVMLLTSWNVLITLYAIITISLAITGNVASIVLLGWRLNIIESVTISLAVGLSIDFTIHYGVAYRLSDAKDSKSRVNESFLRVGGAVAMAALTTFSAGAAVIPGHVLPYTKLGIFLMLCMSFSWVYATFFFQSVCRIIGPKGNFCQMSLGCFKRLARCRENSTNSDVHSLKSVDSNDSFLLTF